MELKSRCRVNVAAKINIGLLVGEPRADGYHPVLGIMHPISLFDSIEITIAEGNNGIIVRGAFDCPPERTTVYKAAALFAQAADIHAGLQIHVDKQIPPQAGLGGGSADAAAVLSALNRVSGGPLDEGTLAGLARSIGADVPFFLKGGAAIAAGTGEILQPIQPRTDFGVLLIYPGFGVSTRWAYESLDRYCGDGTSGPLSDDGRRSGRDDDWRGCGFDGPARDLHASAWPSAGAIQAMFAGPVSGWRFQNSFSPMLCANYPVYVMLRDQMERSGAEYVSITGSGSCVYGIFPSPEEAESAKKRFLAKTRPKMSEKTLQSMALFAKRPLERTIYLE